MIRNMWRAVFGDVLTDLGNLEGDYRVTQVSQHISEYRKVC